MRINSPAAAERLQKLKLSFIEQLPKQLAAIREIFLKIEPDALLYTKDHEELHRSIHTLKGAAASFGLKDLAVEASLAESLAESYPSQWDIQMKEHLNKLEELISSIDENMKKEGIETFRVRTAQSSDKPASLDSSDRDVYLFCDEQLECKNLADQIKCFGFIVSTFDDLTKLKSKAVEKRPHIIIIDRINGNITSDEEDILNDIMISRTDPVPLVFVSSKSDIESRLAAVRAGSNAYFAKPVNPSALCNTLHALTTSEEEDPCRILIIDDDIYLSQIYGTILQDAGMQISIVNDPLKAVSVLYEFRPDLILMDMHMPGCSGMELAKVIRQMEEYLSIPIVFLSSETDVDVHFDAKIMGGDEFLVKPIKSHHLISAVSVRAQRMKLIRSFMVKDSMTGLYNHSSIKENLAVQIENAIRNHNKLSFAMIDIDSFKNVNDMYGHPTGDQVLVSLASLLKQRLRKSDIIGRYGGDEFAVILPDCSIKEASDIIEQLRISFKDILFTSGNAVFSSSFSSGVTTLYDKELSSDWASLKSKNKIERICSLADEALYTAKREGRNRVVTNFK